MRSRALFQLFVAFLGLHTGIAAAADRVTASGEVVDSNGNGVEHAAVLVYSAGVKKGLNLFCPTCYIDCGKHTFTNADGSYSVAGLSPDLFFNLLVVREGYMAVFVKKVDPENGPAEAAVLKKRASPDNPAQIVLGKVVDPQGMPVRDALVEQQGAIFGQGRSFGPGGWIDLMAVTNERGEFEIAYSKPLSAAIVQVSPRGMAAKLATVSAGPERKTIIVTEGATIRGRLMKDGKPVANAEIGLSAHSRSAGEVFPEMIIGTDENGKFALTNVPPGRIWYLYGKMESLGARGLAAEIIECETKDDGEDVDVGDVAVKPAYTLHGKISLSDGKPIPPFMRVNLFSRVQDSQTLILPPDGTFEFKGLARGVYSLNTAVKGYEIREGPETELLMPDRDINDFKVLLQPATPPKH